MATQIDQINQNQKMKETSSIVINRMLILMGLARHGCMGQVKHNPFYFIAKDGNLEGHIIK
jgi:hypothetical protein